MKKSLIVIIACSLLLCCCTPSKVIDSEDFPPIDPDYVGVTIPEGMATPTFRMADGRKFKKKETRTENGISIEVTAWSKGAKTATRYKTFNIEISKDPIDPYIVYRLIEPGYEGWHDISITQRELTSYKETDIVTNEANNKGCLNCHNFPGGDPTTMMFHARGAGGGTVFVKGGKANLINLANIGVGKQGTYPTWHPDGRYIVYSSNTTRQNFLTYHPQSIEVYDTASDIILLDTETWETTAYGPLNTADTLETFPSWAPDGKSLYYCAAKTPDDIIADRKDLNYQLFKIDFENGQFVGVPELVIALDSASISFPRINGDWLMFTKSDFATFPIWHKEADLWLYNLKTGELSEAEELNSDDTESYHSWSSNGKWVIFSSRRIDGRYTRLYISHFDGNGHFTKPFLLPQKDPSYNDLRLKSYNIPEFVKGKVEVNNSMISPLFKK